jgi:hypothetical protein
MMNLITQALAAARAEEPIPAMPGHVFEVCLQGQDTHIVQFFRSLSMWKWVGWMYEQVPVPDRRRFEAVNAPHRISPGLYRIPATAAK